MRAPPPLLFATLLLASTAGAAFAQGADTYAPAAGAAPAEAAVRRFYVMTVHLDGVTGLQATAAHPAEAFPAEPLPAGGGLLLRQPNAEGTWGVRAFVFQPGQIVVEQGEPVTLTFVGVHGPRFRIAVDGVAEPIALRRGEARSVAVPADRPGRIGFRSLDHAPSMTGEVLVLPRR
jgi:hypothetical protein